MPIQHISAQAAVAARPSLRPGNQIDRAILIVQGDIGMLAGAFLQRGLNRPAGGVSGVNDPPVAVAALRGAGDSPRRLRYWIPG
jgi:hypothetical protein